MRQIIAIGGGGFGREIGDLKIEKYIVQQSKKLDLKFALFQLLQAMIKDILIIFTKLSIQLTVLHHI